MVSSQVAEAKRQSEDLLASANREAMRAEDRLARVWRLYQSRSQSPWGEMGVSIKGTQK